MSGALVREASSLYTAAFSSEPAAAASAPGRVNLLGEHTDYNGGPVLPLALRRRTAVVAGSGPDWAASSSGAPEPTTFQPARPGGNWTDYLAGVAAELRELDIEPGPARIAVASTVPIGAGLSSSAALTVAAARALAGLAGRRLTREQLVEVAFRAEHDRVGVRCGRMDQTIAVFGKAGHALLLESASGARQLVPMPWRVWLVETGVSHRLTGGDYNRRRAECEAALAALQTRWPHLRFLADLPERDLAAARELLAPDLFSRTRHVVTETARTRAAAAALAAGDRAELGRLLLAGHRSLQGDFESSCPEADLIVERAAGAGADGARLTGAGWGGAVLVLMDPARAGDVLGSIRREFRARFGRRPAIWSTTAGGGARPEKLTRLEPGR